MPAQVDKRDQTDRITYTVPDYNGSPVTIIIYKDSENLHLEYVIPYPTVGGHQDWRTYVAEAEKGANVRTVA